jgi:hypothetical protein
MFYRHWPCGGTPSWRGCGRTKWTLSRARVNAGNAQRTPRGLKSFVIWPTVHLTSRHHFALLASITIFAMVIESDIADPHTMAPILQLSRFHPASKPRLPRWRGRVTPKRGQVRPDVAVCISATGTLIVPPSIRPGKCGLRREPDVVDQMKLPTGLGFAIAAQIHVSHSPKIIRLRARRLLPGCRSWPYAHREIPTRKRTSFHRRT